jgi:hypothetical protein
MRATLVTCAALVGLVALLGGCGGRTPLSDPASRPSDGGGGFPDGGLVPDLPVAGPDVGVDGPGPVPDRGPPSDLSPDRPDLPPPIETLAYRVIAMGISQFGETPNSDFPRVLSELLTLAVSGGGADRGVDAYDLVLALTPGPGGPSAITLTLCRARNVADRTYACARPRSTTTAYYQGSLVSGTEPLPFFFDLTVKGQRESFRLDELTMSGGPVDRSADWTIGWKAKLGGFFECPQPFVVPSGTCPGGDVISLQDLIDGPVEGCGQDGSLGPSCSYSTDPVTHNPQPESYYFVMVGSMRLTPVILVDE